MLVLSREIGEAVLAGNVRIVVVDVRRDKVRLGFECPDDVPIWREEIVQQKAAGGQPIQSHAKLHRAVRKSQEHLRDGGGE